MDQPPPPPGCTPFAPPGFALGRRAGARPRKADAANAWQSLSEFHARASPAPVVFERRWQVTLSDMQSANVAELVAKVALEADVDRRTAVQVVAGLEPRSRAAKRAARVLAALRDEVPK